jgi:predicted P-loop ATPase
MVVIENEEQGTEKSTMLATLTGHEDWFSDDLPLNISGKEIIERLRGRWIVEAAELSGMRRADIEHLKAFLSRRIDRARMAYGHFVVEAPRECIISARPTPLSI